MAVIKFTKADVLRSRNLEGDKWYSWQITKVEGPKLSKGQDSYNYHVTLSLIDFNEVSSILRSGFALAATF